jgi:hypothetical protein
MADSDFKKIERFYLQVAGPKYGTTEEDFEKIITVGYWTKDNEPQYP